MGKLSSGELVEVVGPSLLLSGGSGEVGWLALSELVVGVSIILLVLRE